MPTKESEFAGFLRDMGFQKVERRTQPLTITRIARDGTRGEPAVIPPDEEKRFPTAPEPVFGVIGINVPGFPHSAMTMVIDETGQAWCTNEEVDLSEHGFRSVEELLGNISSKLKRN